MTTTVKDLPRTDTDFSDETLTDLHPLLRAMREESPVWRVRSLGQDALMLLSYELVSAGFRDEENLPCAPSRASSAQILGPHLSSLGGEEHRRKRAIFSPPFRARVIPRYMEMIVETANDLIDDFVAAGEADLVKQFTKRYPMRVISNMLGLPRGNDEEMSRMALDLLRINYEPEVAFAAKQKYIDMVTPLIEDRRAHPRDDLISFIVGKQADEPLLDDEDVHGFVRHLFPAGADTTYLGMGNTLLALLTQPHLMEIARNQPEKRRALVEEGLRWDSPVALLPRMSNMERDLVWHDFELPQAKITVFGIMSANRDAAAFTDPDLFDPDREPENPVMTFGFGTHYCVGSHLAVAEISAGLGALIDRLDGLALAPGAEPKVMGGILRGPASLPVTFTPGR